MKPRKFLPFLAAFCFAHTAPASEITWDTTTGDNAVVGGAGDWNTSTTHWTTDGGDTNIAWDNSANASDTALFTTGTGRILITEDIDLAGITLSSVNSSTIGGRGSMVYVFQGAGNLDFGGQQGAIDTTAIGLLNSQIDNNLTGTGGLVINATGGASGDGRLILVGDNTGLSGGITVNSGLLAFNNPNALGANTITLNGGGLFGPVQYSGTASTAVAGATAVTVTNDIVLNEVADPNLFRIWGGRTVAFSGVISGSGELHKTDGGTAVMDNAGNTLESDVFVKSGLLRVGQSNSNSPTFGTAAAIAGSSLTVESGGTLELLRDHSGGFQTVNWSVPDITLDGGTLQFRGTTGSNGQNLAADIHVASASTISYNGGGFQGGCPAQP